VGDLASKKQSSQTSQVFNQQVTQSGRGQIGISGSTLSNSSVTVVEADAEIASKALEAMAIGLNGAAVLAAGGVSVAGKAVDGNTRVAESVVVASQQAVTHAFNALSVNQARALQTVDAAVAAAQQTALNSTAIPQSTLSEKVTKQVLVAAVIAIGLVVVTVKSK
jgi:hypothetical protein